MARKKQTEELPGMESPARIPELHALAIELYDLQNERMDLTKREKAKREEVRVELEKRSMTDYVADGWELYLEAGTPKVKVRRDADDEEEE